MQKVLGCTAVVVGMLFFQGAALAGALGGFGFQKVSCADKQEMQQVAVEYASGQSDGLIPEGCELLPARSVVLIDDVGTAVPGYDNLYIYRIHRVRGQHIVQQYYRYVAMRSDVSPNPD